MDSKKNNPNKAFRDKNKYKPWEAISDIYEHINPEGGKISTSYSLQREPQEEGREVAD